MRRFVFLTMLFFAYQANAQEIGAAKPTDFEQYQATIAHGQIDSIFYRSTTVDTVRKALIYLPPHYTKTKKYPVLYLLHGIGGDAYEWYRMGNVAQILDNLYAQNKLIPMIVVLPNGRAMKDDRAIGNVMDSVKVQAFTTFEKDLLVDLMPSIAKHYPVVTSRDKQALAGLSMGGGQSLNIGLHHIEKFAWIGAFSPAPNTKVPDELLSDIIKTKLPLHLLWLSCGDKDRLLYISTRTYDALSTNKIPHIYHVEAGNHDFNVWKNDLYHFTQRLFRNAKP